jgi:hypothetical protein
MALDSHAGKFAVILKSTLCYFTFSRVFLLFLIFVCLKSFCCLRFLKILVYKKLSFWLILTFILDLFQIP